MISGNMVGSYSQMGKTFILVDEEGNEITGVCVDNPVVFTAGDNDVREGMVYASDDGVSTGTKNIPAYHTSEGYKLIPVGSVCSVKLSKYDAYDYDHLQALICDYNTSIADSVATSKVVIENNVYEVNSTVSIATTIKNVNEKTVEFGITNNGTIPYVIRYFTYKEII